MKIFALLAVLILLSMLIVVGVMTATTIREYVRHKRTRGARWAPSVSSPDGGTIRVTVERLGRHVPVAELNPAAPSFETDLYAARARADDLAMELNASERSTNGH